MNALTEKKRESSEVETSRASRFEEWSPSY